MKFKVMQLLIMTCGLSCTSIEDAESYWGEEFRYLYSVVPSYSWPVVHDTVLRADVDLNLRIIYTPQSTECYRNDSLVFRCHVSGSTFYEDSPSSDSCIDYIGDHFIYKTSCGELFDLCYFSNGDGTFAHFFELPFNFLETQSHCSYSVWRLNRFYVD